MARAAGGPHSSEMDDTRVEPTGEDALFSYAIVRADLAMPPGKMASQASHAFVHSLLRFLERDPNRSAEFLALGTSGSRVVLTGRNEEDLLKAHAQAEALGLPCALFVDSGHVMAPAFDGSPVATALGIGPASKDALRPVVRRFRCA